MATSSVQRWVSAPRLVVVERRRHRRCGGFGLRPAAEPGRSHPFDGWPPDPSTDARGGRTGYSAAMDAPSSDSRAAGSGQAEPTIAVRDVLIVLVPVVVLAALTFGIHESRVRGGDVLTLITVVLPLLAVRRWPIPVLLVVAAGSTVTAPMLETPWVQ